MSLSLRFILMLSVLVLGAPGCLFYVQPRADEPHANARLRTRYHSYSFGSFAQVVTVNGLMVFPDFYGNVPGTPPRAALRIRPEPTRWIFRTEFSHEESYWEQEMQTRHETVPCPPAPAVGAVGAVGAVTFCTVPRSAFVSVHKTRKVVDAECAASTEHLPRADAEYLLHYEYFGHGDCTLRCYEERLLEDGSREQHDCR